MSSGKRVAIVQSCYIPWKGYFDLINLVDEFILYDDRQYTRRDWRNRNRIKTAQGPQWLTIPVEVKGRYHQRIDETRIDDSEWGARHWKTLQHAYAAAPNFDDHRDLVEELYADPGGRLLSVVNRRFLAALCDVLGIDTKLSWSTEYEVEGTKTERLVNLCRAAGADAYLSGPNAREYMEEDRFASAGIVLEYMDYDGYPEYPQLHPPFDHNVTILDLLFSTGADAPRYMKSFALEPARGR
jgi:WbqC-like protein family